MANHLRRFLQDPRPPETRFLVDILGSLFPVIRRIFLKHGPITASIIFEQHLRSLQLPQENTRLYLDGPSPEEKRETQNAREARRATALVKADALLSEMELILSQEKRLRKQHFKKLHKSLDASFYLPSNLRTALARYLEGKGWTVIECVSEADIQIACDCTAYDIVLSGDSDSLIHSSIHTIWRPLSRGGYLEYNVPQLLQHLELSRIGLTVLGVVSRNDYTSNIKQMGLATNYNIIKSLEGLCKYQFLSFPFSFIALLDIRRLPQGD